MFFIDWQTTPLVDFNKLTLPSKPNYCLISAKCHSERCIQAPVFDRSALSLSRSWKRMLEQQPRVRMLNHDTDSQHYQYVQRSKWLRFPDLIDVQFVDISTKQSTLLAFSRSVYGYSDLGVNCKRLRHWLEALNEH